MNLTRTLDASMEALTLPEVKKQLRVTSTADDDSFRHFITAVRHWTEIFLGKTLITSTWQYKLDSFQDVICLPMPPVKSITTVAYTDTDGNAQTFTDYQYDESGRIKPAYGKSWPSTRNEFDAVTITYIAGETDAGQVDDDIKHAMLLLIGAADIGREDIVIGAGVVVSELKSAGSAQNLLKQHRLMRI